MARFIEKNLEKDGVDQRGFLKCMAWAGNRPGRFAGADVKVPGDKLRQLLGITDVNFVRGIHSLAIVDSTLA